MKPLTILFFTSIFFVSITLGQQKTFIREYTYRASDADSKVSSREKALKEVKALLLEELGIYVESYVNYEVQEENGKLNKDFFTNEIKTISAGISEAKILEEKWDGYNYYVKAELQADPDDVVRRINQTLDKRRSSAVIDSLQILIQYSEVEIKARKEELSRYKKKVDLTNAELSTLKVETRQKENSIDSLTKEVSELKSKLSILDIQESELSEAQIQLIKEFNEMQSEARQFANNVLIGQVVTFEPQIQIENGTRTTLQSYRRNVYYRPRSGLVLFSYEDWYDLKWRYSRYIGAFKDEIAQEIIDSGDTDKALRLIRYTYSSQNLIKHSLPGY